MISRSFLRHGDLETLNAMARALRGLGDRDLASPSARQAVYRQRGFSAGAIHELDNAALYSEGLRRRSFQDQEAA